jgi:two-component system chemotaxis response regulator CheY
MFKKVLAVDDSDLVLNLHQLTFRRLPQVQLLLARNGVEAFKKLKENPDIDLILLDINMPFMDGITFLDSLRREPPPLGKIPVVMITTEGEEESVVMAMKKGANAYIKKPFRQKELFELLEVLETKLKSGSA